MKAEISQHAVERFQKRWAPDLNFWDAFAEVKHLVERAVAIKERPSGGGELYESEGIRFVVKRELGDRHPVVVTVLSAEPLPTW